MVIDFPEELCNGPFLAMNTLKSCMFDNCMKESKFLQCASRANFSIIYILIYELRTQMIHTWCI